METLEVEVQREESRKTMSDQTRGRREVGAPRQRTNREIVGTQKDADHRNEEVRLLTDLIIITRSDEEEVQVEIVVGTTRLTTTMMTTTK